MKKIVLAAALAAFTVSGLQAQAKPLVYQSGDYIYQSRPAYEEIRGTVTEKYEAGGLYWLTLVDGNTTYKVSVAQKAEWGRYSETERLILKRCFKLSSNKWKRN